MLNSSNSLQKLFRRYSRDRTRSEISCVSGNDVVSGKTFSYYVLDRVFKIVPVKIQCLVDVAVGYCCGFENLKHILQRFFCRLFTEAFLGEVKYVGYSGCGNITLKKVLFCQAENESGIGIPRLAVQKNIKRNIGVDKQFHYRCFANLSLRISSTLISVCSIPVNETKVSSCSNVSIIDLVKRISSFFSVFLAVIGVKAIIASPAGISRGMSMVSLRRFSVISTVCVMVIY